MTIPDAVQRLGHLPLFKGLSPEALLQIGNLAEERSYAAGEAVFRQGDPLDACYFVEHGAVMESNSAATGATLLSFQADPGRLLDRWAVLNNENHRSTATTIQPSVLLRFSTPDFHSVLNRFPGLRERIQRAAQVSRLRAIPLFSGLDEELLFQVADLAEEVGFDLGQIIFGQGQSADCFYVIDSGRVIEDVSFHPPGSHEWPRYLTAGSFFGRHSLLHGTKRRASATADTPVRLFRFSAAALDWLRQLQPGFDDALVRFPLIEALRAASIFRRLEERDLKRLAGYVGLVHFPQDAIIAYQGETDPTFYQLYRGRAVVLFRNERGQDRPVRVMGAGESAGEKCLFFEEPWGFTLKAGQPTDMFYLYRDDLNEFVVRYPDVKPRLVPDDPFAPKVSRAAFGWLELDERVILQTRRHWFALFNSVLSWQAVLVVATFLVLWLLFRGSPGEVAVFLAAAVLALVYLWWRVVDWRNDYFVVTSRRVVQREKVLWISEQVREVPLGRVQNVNINAGPIGNWMHYGRLDVDTAATSGVQPLRFKFLPNPNDVQKSVFEEMERVRALRWPQARRSIRQRLEAGTGRGIRPNAPKPVAPPSRRMESRTDWLGRAYNRTLGALFWVERRSGTEVTWRKHRLRLLIKTAAPLLAALFVILAYGFLAPDKGTWLPLLFFFLLPIGLWWWWRWVDWGNDQYILTGDRIIDTERLPLGLRSRRTETIFDRIQNVTFNIPNPIATLFNYGTVSIHTAGTEGILDFPYVPRPRQVQAEIFRRIAAHEEDQRRKQQEQFEVADWFSVYDQTRP